MLAIAVGALEAEDNPRGLNLDLLSAPELGEADINNEGSTWGGLLR